jgi:Domain of unknown function (DUF4413)
MIYLNLLLGGSNPAISVFDPVKNRKNFVKMIIAHKYPFNLFFSEFCEIYLSIKKICSSSYLFIVNMGTKIFAKWDNYWTSVNTLLAVACVLDPIC